MPEHNSYKAAMAQVTAALEKAQTELDMLAHTVVGGTARLSLDNQLRIITASQGYYQMTGYTEEESKEPPFSSMGLNLVIPEDIPIVEEALQKLAEDKPAQVSYRIRKKDGSIAWNTAYCAKIFTTEPERYIDVFFIDTTTSRLTEIELSSLLNHLPVGVVRATIDDKILIQYANREFFHQIGYRRDEFVGTRFHNNYLLVVHADDRRKLLEWSRKCSDSTQESGPIDYRIIAKDSSVLWMRAKTIRINDPLEERPLMQGIITDITEEHQRQLEIAHNEERYRIISEQTRDTVFDWDIVNDRIQFSSTYEKMFGFTPPPDLPIRSLTESDIIFADDKPLVEQMIQNILAGEPYTETVYRAKCADSSYIWCRNRVTTIFDDNRQPSHAIGVLSDIDDYMQKTNSLQEQAMRDSLTGLFNRMAFQRQVEHKLQKYPDHCHAFLLLDVDHFKQINDTFGHMEGDRTLQFVAGLLTKQFRNTDFLSRMGGDEFSVFMTDIPSVQTALEKGAFLKEEIFRRFNQGLPDADPDYTQVRFSISMGIAIYPEDGKSFSKLYSHADQALYRGKREGGNTCLR